MKKRDSDTKNREKDGNKRIIRKKICYLLPEMFMVAVLACACSARQKAEDAVVPPTEQTAPAESDAADDIDTNPAADQTIAPDLNRNGIAEEVRLTDIDDGLGQRLEIYENDELIDSEAGYFAHAGQTSVFLCTIDGEDYLLRYHPTMYQGVCTYSYELSTLTDNVETTVQWNEVNFDINFGSPVHDFDPEAIAAFMNEINDLLSHSVQMLNTASDLLATFEKEGRLYDSLWWLDASEPDFIRDENKSLLENLEAFQTAMTAAQSPVTPEAADGLPITDPLEMAFYSGAGAWATYLILNPDGSFEGDYYDDDVLTVYVCRFHGQFGNIEKLTDASWLLTLETLELDTGHSIGEEWDETDGDYTYHYISSEPNGFSGADGTALNPGAQFILYSPDATGHEPGTELYGAADFQHWMHEHREFHSADDILGCWGLQNVETGDGFFDDSNAD